MVHSRWLSASVVWEIKSHGAYFATEENHRKSHNLIQKYLVAMLRVALDWSPAFWPLYSWCVFILNIITTALAGFHTPTPTPHHGYSK
jgi:hypothetical protein